jgi:hypothetical protein
MVALVAEGHETLIDLIERQQQHFEHKIGALETRIGALNNENVSLKLILENLRITQRGERGIDGDRGPSGTGRQGRQSGCDRSSR